MIRMLWGPLMLRASTAVAETLDGEGALRPKRRDQGADNDAKHDEEPIA